MAINNVKYCRLKASQYAFYDDFFNSLGGGDRFKKTSKEIFYIYKNKEYFSFKAR